jgi:hypothetical protein
MNWQLARKVPSFGALAIALVAVSVSQAQVNLVPNGDFEVDADMSGNPDLWFRGGTTAYVTNDDSDGVGTDSVSSQNGADWRSQAFAVAPGQVLRYALDYKVSQGATGTIRTDLRFFTGMSGGGTSGAFQGEFAPTTDVATVPQGVWNTLGPFSVTVPAGSAPPLVVPAFGDVRLSAGVFGPALVGTVQFDNIRVIIPEPATLALAMITAGVACTLLRRSRESRR